MNKPNTECFICKKRIHRINRRLQERNFCSYGCRNKYFSKEKSFVWKGGKRDQAKDYKDARIRRKKYKQIAVEKLGGKCAHCGYCKTLAALDFHHVKEKDHTIKNIISGSLEKILKEIEKCILLCSNCHRELHARLRENE